MNVGIAFQRQKVDVLTHNSLSFGKHLRLANPQSRGGDSYGKIVDFDAVELVDAHLDRAFKYTKLESCALTQCKNCTIFKAAQREIGFSEEISATASRVEERERSELVAVGIEARRKRIFHFYV